MNWGMLWLYSGFLKLLRKSTLGEDLALVFTLPLKCPRTLQKSLNCSELIYLMSLKLIEAVYNIFILRYFYENINLGF